MLFTLVDVPFWPVSTADQTLRPLLLVHVNKIIHGIALLVIRAIVQILNAHLFEIVIDVRPCQVHFLRVGLIGIWVPVGISLSLGSGGVICRLLHLSHAAAHVLIDGTVVFLVVLFWRSGCVGSSVRPVGQDDWACGPVALVGHGLADLV